MWKSVHVRVGVAVFGGVFGGAWALHVALDYRKRKLTITPWDLEDHPAPITDPNLTLKSAQVFFRHGARTPLSHLPKQVEEVNNFAQFPPPSPHRAHINKYDSDPFHSMEPAVI